MADPAAVMGEGKSPFRVYFYDPGSCQTVACPSKYRVEPVGRGHYLLHKGEIAYAVDIEQQVCTCPDYLLRKPKRGCKHLRLFNALRSAT